MRRKKHQYRLTFLLLSGLLFSVVTALAEDGKMSWDAIFEGVQMQQQAPVQNVNFPGPYQPGERVKQVTGDPGLADLADPGWKHVPKPPGDPGLGHLGRPSPPPSDTVIAPPAPGQKAPTKLQPGVTPPPSDTRIRQSSPDQLTPTRLQPGVTPSPSDTRVRTPSPDQLTPTKLQPGVTSASSDTRIRPPTGGADGRGFPGPYQPGERVKQVTGDPGLADLADPGWKHVPKTPGDPDLGRLGQRTPSSTSQSTVPTKVDASVPALGEGTPTRIRDAGVTGGRRPEPLTEGKSSFAPDKKLEPSLAEQVMSGVSVAGAIADPATREMGDALRDNRPIDAGQVVKEASGVGTYDIGRRHAEEQLQRHHAGEQSKVEAAGRALTGTADEMVLQPIREIVHRNLGEMESRADAEGRRPTMTEGAGMFFGTMAEVAGAGFRPLLNAAYESQNYEAMGEAGGMRAELEQFVDRNLTEGQRNVRQLQDQIENVMHNGDPGDPATGAQLQGLLDRYDAEYDRMQRLEGMTERTLTHDPDRMSNVKNTVGHMTDAASMRDYAADIFEGRGGSLPADDSASVEESKSKQTGTSLTPESIEELVRKSEDKNMTQAERDQATHDLMGVLDVLRGAKKQDEGGGDDGGGEGAGKETGEDVADWGKGPIPAGETDDDSFWRDLVNNDDLVIVPMGNRDPVILTRDQVEEMMTDRLRSGDITWEEATRAAEELRDYNRDFKDELSSALERGWAPESGVTRTDEGGEQQDGSPDLPYDDQWLQDLAQNPDAMLWTSRDGEFGVTSRDEVRDAALEGIFSGDMTPEEMIQQINRIGGLNREFGNAVEDAMEQGLLSSSTPRLDDADALSALRDAEGSVGDGGFSGGAGYSGDVWDGYLDGSRTHRDRTEDIQMMANAENVRQASVTGDDLIRQSANVRNSGGRDAAGIIHSSAASAAAGDRKNSWGNVLGDSVADGIKEGASQAASTFGQAAADRASAEVFGGTKPDKSVGGSGSGDSQDVASTGSGGGPYVNTHKPNMIGSGSGGTKGDKKPPPQQVRGAPCPKCGKPMVFGKDGQWHCPDSAYVRNNPGVIQKPPATPPVKSPPQTTTQTTARTCSKCGAAMMPDSSGLVFYCTKCSGVTDTTKPSQGTQPLSPVRLDSSGQPMFGPGQGFHNTYPVDASGQPIR